jgi:hypothetical protein
VRKDRNAPPPFYRGKEETQRDTEKMRERERGERRKEKKHHAQ